ncbi:MAG: hypothetical protein AAB802_00505, partial [Patescibacteria group bacterium]
PDKKVPLVVRSTPEASAPQEGGAVPEPKPVEPMESEQPAAKVNFTEKPDAYLDLSSGAEAAFQIPGKQRISFMNKLIRIGDHGFRVKAKGYPLSFESVEPNPDGSFHFEFKAKALGVSINKRADLTVTHIRGMLDVLEKNQNQDEFKHVVTIPGDDTYDFEFKAV